MPSVVRVPVPVPVPVHETPNAANFVYGHAYDSDKAHFWMRTGLAKERAQRLVEGPETAASTKENQ